MGRKFYFYRRSLLNLNASVPTPQWFNLTQILFSTLGALTPSDVISDNLHTLYQERAINSQEFFTKHASEFHEKRLNLASRETHHKITLNQNQYTELFTLSNK